MASIPPVDEECSSPADIRERARHWLEREIEFVDSPRFAAAGAAERILGRPSALKAVARRGTPAVLRADAPPLNPTSTAAPAGTPPYLATLYEFPLLTREQEYDLFQRMNFLKYEAETLRRRIDLRRPRAALLDQIEANLEDALTIRNRIAQSNLRLVVSIARTLVDAANSFDELVSEGNVPLLRAVEIFDVGRGTRFSTYATWAVRNSLFRIGPRNRRRQKRFATVGEAPFQAARDPRPNEHDMNQHHEGVRASVAKLLDGLAERDRRIVMARFGMADAGSDAVADSAVDGAHGENERPRKFREIAETLNLSTERVRQLLGRAMNQLREAAPPELADLK